MPIIRSWPGYGSDRTSAANLLAADADLVIAIGTRLGDFTTASKTSFQTPAVKFININVAEFDVSPSMRRCR